MTLRSLIGSCFAFVIAGRGAEPGQTVRLSTLFVVTFKSKSLRLSAAVGANFVSALLMRISGPLTRNFSGAVGVGTSDLFG